jgi:hypothetical protein
MKRTILLLTAAILAAPLALIAQSGPSSDSSSVTAAPVAPEPNSDNGGGVTASPYGVAGDEERPLSRVGFEAGISALGIKFEGATNISSHFNVRAGYNFFNYSMNYTSDGITANGALNLSSAGVMLDVYPFHNSFHISPGVLVMNNNKITATVDVPAGSSFTVNDQTYYSANPNAATGATPVVGNGLLGLNTNKPAFTLKGGWGNIARRHGHWSVPFEAGVAFIGDPKVKVSFGGWACLDQAQTQCSDLSDPTNPIAIQVQSNLNAQVAKWTNDIDLLRFYPIGSVGLAYSFHTR